MRTGKEEEWKVSNMVFLQFLFPSVTVGCETRFVIFESGFAAGGQEPV